MPAEPRSWRSPRWRFVLALSAALILHIGLLLVMREALQWRPALETPTTVTMELRLIDVAVLNAPPVASSPVVAPADPAVAAAQEPQQVAVAIPPPQPSRSSAPGAPQKATPDAAAPAENTTSASATFAVLPPSIDAIVNSASSASDSASVASASGANASTNALPRERQPRLVTPNGKVLLPEIDVAVAAAAARFPTRRVVRAGGSDPLSRRSPLPYVSTRFDPLWVPDGETLVGTLLRKLDDKITKRSSTEIAGLQVNCVWILIVAGCTWGVPPRISIDELKKMRADLPMPRGPRTQPGG